MTQAEKKPPPQQPKVNKAIIDTWKQFCGIHSSRVARPLYLAEGVGSVGLVHPCDSKDAYGDPFGCFLASSGRTKGSAAFIGT